MSGYRIRAAADDRLNDIARYTAARWGPSQAVRYIEGLFAQFEAIAKREVPWTRIPGRHGIDGYRRHWRSHVIYWKTDVDGIAIVSVLHERMDQFARLKDDAAREDER